MSALTPAFGVILTNWRMATALGVDRERLRRARVSDEQDVQHLIEMRILAFEKPDGGDVGVGEALFGLGFPVGITRAGEDA